MNGIKHKSKAFPLARLFNITCVDLWREHNGYFCIPELWGRRENCAFNEKDQHTYIQDAVACLHLSHVNSYLLDAGAVKLIPDH